jgi:hypothetical protein
MRSSARSTLAARQHRRELSHRATHLDLRSLQEPNAAAPAPVPWKSPALIRHRPQWAAAADQCGAGAAMPRIRGDAVSPTATAQEPGAVPGGVSDARSSILAGGCAAVDPLFVPPPLCRPQPRRLALARAPQMPGSRGVAANSRGTIGTRAADPLGRLVRRPPFHARRKLPPFRLASRLVLRPRGARPGVGSVSYGPKLLGRAGACRGRSPVEALRKTENRRPS